MKGRLLLPLVIIAVSVPLLLVAWAQFESASWIVSLTPQDPYIGQPVTFKAYSYSAVFQKIYSVTCLLTFRNDTDILWFARASGAPATYSFTISSGGTYALDVFCSDENGNQYATTYTISVRNPTPLITPTSYRWGRPLKLDIAVPYPYNNVPITILYRGTQYTATLINGRASVELPPIYEPETVTVVLFGVQTSIDVTPTLPKVSLRAPTTIKNPKTVSVVLEDDLGPLDVRWPVAFNISGSCTIEPRGAYYTNTEYVVAPNRANPFAVETCNITASLVFWKGADPIQLSAVCEVLPVNVINASLWYINSTLQSYTFVASAEFDELINGSLVLYIDGVPVASVANTSMLFALSYTVDLLPGLHTVSAVFISGTGTANVGAAVITVPLQYGTLPPNTVYAGEPIELPNAYWYIYKVNRSTLYVVAYYPYGYTMYKINIVYPTINLTEKELNIYNAAPGSTVKLFCGVNGERKFIAELHLSGTNVTWSIPFDCDYVVAVYTYKQYTEVVYANEPTTIEITSVCTAGELCVVVPTHPKVLYAEVNGVTFRAGEAVRLPAGYYTVKVYTTDGLVIEHPLTVVHPRILVVTYREPGVGWRLKIYGPSTAEISVALSDGRVIMLKPGEYVLYSEPVSAYWKYGKVDFVKLEYLSCSSCMERR